jgi:hypothetical protein
MGFSERTFEFCYNSEFCQRNRALLASYPYIPSQRAEGDLGYDVEFEIRDRTFTRSIFLQHKVVFYAQNRAGKNQQFYDAHAGAYFRFPVDNDQHKVLRELSRRRGDVYYCAPRFRNRSELELFFRTNSITNNSVWLDLSSFRQIRRTTSHTITFDPSGSPAFLHSEIQKIEGITSVDQVLDGIKQQHIDDRYIHKLAEQLLSSAARGRRAELIPKNLTHWRPIERAQYILGHIYEVSWLLIP